MSPVAAEFASACSADGDACVEVGAEGVLETTDGVDVVAGAPLLCEPAQPATSTAPAKRQTERRTHIGADDCRICLNGA